MRQPPSLADIVATLAEEIQEEAGKRKHQVTSDAAALGACLLLAAQQIGAALARQRPPAQPADPQQNGPGPDGPGNAEGGSV